MPMPDRNVEGDYRYAYQGQEKDAETGKEAFQLRLWDGRIGRWLSTDPYGQYHSPYMGMGNNPINGVDLDGGIWTPKYIRIGSATIDVTALKVAYLKSAIDNKISSLSSASTFSLSIKEKEDVKRRIGALNATKRYIDKIGGDESNQYSFSDSGFTGEIQETIPDGANSILIPFDVSSVDNIALTIHEVIHASQVARKSFLIAGIGGEFTFTSKKGRNIVNEVEGYKVQYAFEPTSIPNQQKADFEYFGGLIKETGTFEKKLESIRDIDTNFVLRLYSISTGALIYYPTAPRENIKMISPRFF